MKKTYNLIYTYKDQHFYEESYQPVDEVLTFNMDNNQNLFDQLKEERPGQVPHPDLKRRTIANEAKLKMCSLIVLERLLVLVCIWLLVES